jgi:hypothetical protein
MPPLLLAALLCLGMSFDLRTIIMLIIGGGILGATMVLTGVVLCLYFKVSKALK